MESSHLPRYCLLARWLVRAASTDSSRERTSTTARCPDTVTMGRVQYLSSYITWNSLRAPILCWPLCKLQVSTLLAFTTVCFMFSSLRWGRHRPRKKIQLLRCLLGTGRGFVAGYLTKHREKGRQIYSLLKITWRFTEGDPACADVVSQS